ncbi:hypothetical protein ACWDBD_49010 [Streptomyces sp. NPDC001118]
MTVTITAAHGRLVRRHTASVRRAVSAARFADLPGWDIVDTILSLHERPEAHGWLRLDDPTRPREKPQALGRDLEGRLFVDSSSTFDERISKSAVEMGYFALLTGVEDGVALWLPVRAYRHIKPIDPNAVGEQPDVPRWLPIREVLKEAPAQSMQNLAP